MPRFTELHGEGISSTLQLEETEAKDLPKVTDVVYVVGPLTSLPLGTGRWNLTLGERDQEPGDARGPVQSQIYPRG